MSNSRNTSTTVRYSFAGEASCSPEAAVDDDIIPIRRLGKVAGTVLKYCEGLLPRDWRVLQWSMETDETVIESHGSVEIRQVPAGCIAQTCVEGGMDAAREIALALLASYVSGDNLGGVPLDAERPVVQQRKSPGVWSISVRLAAVQDAADAPSPRTPNIRIVAQNPMTLAVAKVDGRSCEQVLARAESAIAASLEHTHWLASGKAALRIHAPRSLSPFAESCELAMPVSKRVQHDATVAATDKKRATPGSPPVR